jgi:hypothetical protein
MGAPLLAWQAAGRACASPAASCFLGGLCREGVNDV